jgi:DNA-binding TFAR19-related protein (PDSD5 family)
MSENVVETLQKLIQDVVAPDVRELKVRMTALEKQTETQYNALRDQQDANFKAIMAAIGESRAKSDLETYKLIAALSERVTALETAAH